MSTNNLQKENHNNSNYLNIGKRIAEIRKYRDFNLKNLANSSGITSSMLSQIERGLTNPSLSTIIRIAEALKVQPSKLFTGSATMDELILRSHKRKKFSYSDDVGVVHDLLTPTYKGRIELAEIFLKPNGISSNIENSTDQKAVIIAGTVELVLYGQHISLDIDDSVHIPCNTPHQWRNACEGISRIITAQSQYEI